MWTSVGRRAREGVEIDTSTLADWVGACVVALDLVLAELRRHVFAAERLHGDDTTVPVLAKTKTAPAACGPMCATIGRSAATDRQRLLATTRLRGMANIRARFWPSGAA